MPLEKRLREILGEEMSRVDDDADAERFGEMLGEAAFRAMARATHDLVEVLRYVEWTPRDGEGQHLCPACGFSRVHGHEPGCEISEILSYN